jgi:hypothetical protein
MGDVEETIYVVEEDENEEETIRVCLAPSLQTSTLSYPFLSFSRIVNLF